MKNKILHIALFFPIMVSLAQKIVPDKAFLIAEYKHSWTFDTLKNEIRDDLIILQIGKNISKSYSYYTFQSDSLNNAPNGKQQRREMTRKAVKEYLEKGTTDNFMYRRMSTFVYKDYSKNIMTVTDRLSLQDYMYEDKLNAQDWQMTDSTKEVLGYVCQKAVCFFRGRHWTAWFAPDIPVSDGPWKFGGLPGLIMEVYDRGNQYHFIITGLQKVDNEPIVFSPTHLGSKKFEKTTRLDFLKAKKRYLMDMNGYIQMETGIDLSGGQPAKIMRYELMERDYEQ